MKEVHSRMLVKNLNYFPYQLDPKVFCILKGNHVQPHI